ncbi:MAG: PEP-CTERM/exosortase system-associated acyltransferase [Thiocapsa sp.]|nr:PEP-CTERM/exosortase system-associated acyltransferase [Thiocapsa sp.]MCG6896361.1 PEP-CTERM/exosortase system-associated acyltransferase [Thiocapsa sp.]MCG6984981.1 PEP-CTERM/exosortase system-associated acyltransferase [Thiocapsa sp.]
MLSLHAGPADILARPPSAGMPQGYFTFRRVAGPDGIRESCRLRYQVFCIERGFLSPKDYPDQEESDCYDAHALHFLARHIDGEPAGTARLVFNGPLGLPFQPHCKLDPRYQFLSDPQYPSRRRYAEISRLAVPRCFRRRAGDGVYGGPPRADRSSFDRSPTPVLPPLADAPEMVAGIFRLIYQESKRRGITHWVVAMERGLHVMLKRRGFVFTPIGPEVDYHGPVRPYVAEIAALECIASRQRRRTFEFMTSALEFQLRPDGPLDS